MKKGWLLRTQIVWLYALVTAIGVLHSPALWSDRGCLSAVPKVSELAVDHLPTLESLSLPPQTILAIQKSAVFQLGQKHKQGRGLVFNFSQLTSNWRSASPIGKGEWLQAHFVSKTLQVAFPEAQFTSGESSSSKERQLSLYFYDTHENGRDFLDDEMLDMRFIKPANTSLSSIDRESVRKTLGVDSKSQMASLYMFNGFKQLSPEPNNPTMQQIALELLASQPQIRVMVLSSNDKMFEVRDLKKYISNNFSQLRGKFDKIVFLSQLPREGLSGSKKYLVINDATGFVPHLHAASDLVILKGPINLYEALMSAVPTVIFNNRDTLGKFDKSEYFRQEGIALKTNRAVTVRSLKFLGQEVQDVLASNAEFVSPADVNVEGKTPMQTYLNHLSSILRYSLETPWRED